MLMHVLVGSYENAFNQCMQHILFFFKFFINVENLYKICMHRESPDSFGFPEKEIQIYIWAKPNILHGPAHKHVP